jgi:hypothetical protein
MEAQLTKVILMRVYALVNAPSGQPQSQSQLSLKKSFFLPRLWEIHGFFEQFFPTTYQNET